MRSLQTQEKGEENFFFFFFNLHVQSGKKNCRVFKSYFQFGEFFSFVARILCINKLRKKEFMEFRTLEVKRVQLGDE